MNLSIKLKAAWPYVKPFVPVAIGMLGLIGAQNTVPAVKRLTDFTTSPPADQASALDVAQFEAMQTRILAAVRALPPVTIHPSCPDIYLDNVNITQRKK